MLDTGHCFTIPVVDPCDGKTKYLETTGECVVSCDAGWWTDGVYCRECHASCSTCSSASDCTVCANGFTMNDATGVCECLNYQYVNPSSGALECNQPCPSLTYTIEATKTCRDCLNTCLSCTNSNTCTTCKGGYTLNTDTNLCDCPVGEVLLNTGVCYNPINDPCDGKPYFDTTDGSCVVSCAAD